MNDQKQMRKLYELFYEAAPTKDLPNQKEKKEASHRFYEFIEKVKEDPTILGEDDSILNSYLADYLQEYAFAAFGVGFALGKSIESEANIFANHLKSAMPLE